MWDFLFNPTFRRIFSIFSGFIGPMKKVYNHPLSVLSPFSVPIGFVKFFYLFHNHFFFFFCKRVIYLNYRWWGFKWFLNYYFLLNNIVIIICNCVWSIGVFLPSSRTCNLPSTSTVTLAPPLPGGIWPSVSRQNSERPSANNLCFELSSNFR